jgi:hypothetical protein
MRFRALRVVDAAEMEAALEQIERLLFGLLIGLVGADRRAARISALRMVSISSRTVRFCFMRSPVPRA